MLKEEAAIRRARRRAIKGTERLVLCLDKINCDLWLTPEGVLVPAEGALLRVHEDLGDLLHTVHEALMTFQHRPRETSEQEVTYSRS